ncbi:PREDICTED: nascent polypeptide-associated complex subunit alpha, muscle-specific form-like [Chinchilla lanigera]|uniref:nascent polypeptide-associated complex subunit alpha, muscle-specific form-like n=1 Tax=Chinchilla lanigera TaxID=34839 RepID=UPI0006980F62|nr:PREDICTED: nascent polypeptide-associated complex subunit alpha, muscle-specific form-like [Chinchilla lanigera]
MRNFQIQPQSSRHFIKDAEREALALRWRAHDTRFDSTTEGCLCSVRQPADRTAPAGRQPAARPTVPGQHPHGFQGNDSRPIRGRVAGLRLADATKGGASCAGLERGQTRARNPGIPAPPPRSPPPLCAGAQLLPPRPPAEREAGNGRRRRRRPPQPAPGARRPGAVSLCFLLTCQSTSRSEPPGAEWGPWAPPFPPRPWSPRVGRSVSLSAAPRWVPEGNAGTGTGGRTGGQGSVAVLEQSSPRFEINPLPARADPAGGEGAPLPHPALPGPGPRANPRLSAPAAGESGCRHRPVVPPPRQSWEKSSAGAIPLTGQPRRLSPNLRSPAGPFPLPSRGTRCCAASIGPTASRKWKLRDGRSLSTVRPRFHGHGASARPWELRCGRRRSKAENPPSLSRDPASSFLCRLPSLFLSSPVSKPSPDQPAALGFRVTARLGDPCLAEWEIKAGGARTALAVPGLFAPALAGSAILCLKRFPFLGTGTGVAGPHVLSCPTAPRSGRPATVWLGLFLLLCNLSSLNATRPGPGLRSPTPIVYLCTSESALSDFLHTTYFFKKIFLDPIRVGLLKSRARIAALQRCGLHLNSCFSESFKIAGLESLAASLFLLEGSAEMLL